jgi:hypothetical protein
MPKDTKSSKRIKTHLTIDFDALPYELQVIIRELGAIQDGVPVQHISRRPIYMDEFKTEPKFTDLYLALEPELTGKVLKVYHYICYSLEVGQANWAVISPTVIAEKMSMRRQHVTNALSVLEKKGLVIRGEKIGRHYKWRLNPEAAWVGRANARWNSIDDIPYSDFIEKRLEYGDEHGFPLGYLRGLRPIEGGRKQNATKEEIERDTAYNRAVRSRLYGEEYADGVDWATLSEQEQARLHIRRAKVKQEMEESGEWDRLYEEFYPSVEKPKAEVIDISEQIKRKKKAQELTEKIMSGEIDPDAIEALLKDSTR